jgi:predicted DCC family thiol-disulfide oxidoreductase YuxK
LTEDKFIILFDGVCNLCNGFVQFIIKHDKKNKFQFASLQSDFAKKVLIKHHEDPLQLSTVVLIRRDKIYKKSSAALYILKDLGGLFPFLFIFIIMPSFLRDLFYNIISKYRYQWFGKKDTCMLPSPELKNRFLD